MTAETLLAGLARVEIVASIAILLVLLLRPLALRRLGASVAYWLWLAVPIAVVAGSLPARERIVPLESRAVIAPAPETNVIESVAATATPAPAPVVAPPSLSLPALADTLVAVWLLVAVALLARSIVTTRRLAADPSVGPALVGVLKPKLVLPADFEARFDAQERALILAHESVHRASGHTVVNALVEVARCASWFNPLAHLAAFRLRTDQELACDAAVIAARPAQRRAYAQALLKTQLAPAFLRLGCTWTSRSAKRMAERIEMIARAPLGRRGKLAGAAAIAAIGAALGYAAWAQQPERVVIERPSPVWTPSAQAPAGTLAHALEAQRHDYFIDLAKKGDIDIVFFGTTETEMWWWENRGRAVWNRELAPRKGANFGSQGTHPESLLWRMQNGELDGYEAKLVVLQLPYGPGGGRIADPFDASREPEFLAGWSAVLAEIRARQPQAKILLLAPVPRGIAPLTTRVEWKEAADANDAVIAKLVDNETVYYANFGERFFLPDGSYNREYWNTPGGVGVGMQPATFEVWAEELAPWIERFVG